MAEKPFAWSYSALTTYETCPKRYYHLYVAKDVKDADSSFSAEGKIVHDAMLQRVVHSKPLPVNMRQHELIAARFARAEGEKYGEMKLALNRQFQPVDYFAPDVWVRVVIDFLLVQREAKKAIIVDWKTGKRKDDKTQLALFSAVLHQYMPEIDFFTSCFAWLQSREITPQTFTLSMLRNTWSDLLPRVGKIEEARKTTTFPAKQSGLCKGYCPVVQCPHFIPRE